MNLCHISPYAATEGLFRAAKDHNSILAIYGPFDLNGQHTSPGNASFHESLKLRNPVWGVRDVSELENTAAACGYALKQRIDMPSNNMTLVFTPIDDTRLSSV